MNVIASDHKWKIDSYVAVKKHNCYGSYQLSTLLKY
jgi:hypothetical protein